MKAQIWLFFLLFCWQLSAQESLQQITDRYAVDYMNSASEYATIFSGNREKPFIYATKNHSYFKEQDFVTGRLSYRGITYPEVQLRWDLYKDELIILSPSNYGISLKSENIDFAELHGYHVYYLRPDSLLGCPPAGNYILLYSGDCSVIEKLSYVLFTETNTMEYYFALSTKFYLKKDGVYHKITNRKSLLKVLNTHRRDLKRFIRANDLRFKRDAEKMVLEVVKEHEKLNRP